MLAQDLPPKSNSVRTPAVDFLVSLGPPAPAYECPNFQGRPLAQVRQELQTAGFSVGQVSAVPSEAGAPGTILAQIPPAGLMITPDTVFTFQVSTEAAAPASKP